VPLLLLLLLLLLPLPLPLPLPLLLLHCFVTCTLIAAAENNSGLTETPLVLRLRVGPRISSVAAEPRRFRFSRRRAQQPFNTMDLQALSSSIAVDVPPNGNEYRSQLAKQPDSELFHCMISYRVSSDADLARAIHDRLHFKTLNAKKKVEFYAAAKYPSGFARARDAKQSWLNIFLDKVCLRPGRDWADAGFIPALLQSITMIPVLSWKESPSGGLPSGSVGLLAGHNAGSPVDNVLLELVLAKELHSTWQAISENASSSRCVLFPCMHIVPVYAQDFFSKLPTLSDDAPAATLQKAADVLLRVGHHTSASFMQQSVKSIITYFTTLQGIKFYDLGATDSANEQVAGLLWDILKMQAREFDIDRFTITAFTQNNPHGSELFEFLKATDAGYLSRFLIRHGISSVALLANLQQSESSIIGLAQETSKVCNRPLMQETMNIKRVINLAAASPLSLSMRNRLLNFVDKDASVLTAIYSSSAFDIMLCKPIYHLAIIAIGFVMIPFGHSALLITGVFDGSAIILLWTGAAVVAASLLAMCFAPRYGRYMYALLFCGNAAIQIAVFVAGYFANGRSVLFHGDEDLLIASRISAEFCRIYQFMSRLLFFLLMLYSVMLKQRIAWRSFTIFMIHYNAFIIIMNKAVLRPPSNASLTLSAVTITVCACLLLVTEISNRWGKMKARNLVLEDLNERKMKWSNFICDSVQFERFEEIDSRLQKSGLGPVCERISAQNDLIPIIVHQEHGDIDRLYGDCIVLNYFFQDWIRLWFISGKSKDEFECCNPKSPFKDAFKLHIEDCFPEVLRGPIKAPNRAIAKVTFLSFCPHN
jgi:hypothetical protein